jgi:hypothetical protein
MVRGMPRRRPRVEVQHAVADDLDCVLGNGHELAPEAVEVVAVEPPRAPLEPAGIDQMRRSDLAHVHAQSRIAAHEHARGARVVEVDVREDEVAQVPDREPGTRERRLERVDARRRTAVDQGGLLAAKQVGGDDPRPPEVEEVEELEAAT